jgi:hypothetical protein
MSSTYGTPKVQQPGDIRVHVSTHSVKIMRVLYFRSFKDLQIRDKEPCSYLDDACFLLSIVPRSFTALFVFSLYHFAFSPLLAWVLSICFHVSPVIHRSTPKVASALSPNRVSPIALPLHHSSTGSAQHGHPLAQ